MTAGAETGGWARSGRRADAAVPALGEVALKGLIGGFVLVLCLAPFVLVLAISFGEKIDGQSWRWALSLASYERFFLGFEWPDALSLVYPQRLAFTIGYALVGAVLATLFAFPFTWAITRTSRRAQTIWLAGILASLSLSEVFVVMGWDILLSGNSGLPMVLRETGVTDWMKATGWFDTFRDWGLASPRDLRFKPSAFATILTMTYLVFPYAVILLYPGLSRLEPALVEAAQTMGARPFTVMRTIIIPLMRVPVIAATLLLFVYLLGAYVAVTVFAAPSSQTLTVTIYDSVRGSTLDAPFGSAQSVVLLATAALCIAASLRLGRKAAGS